jgi:hypothetical protein
MIQTGLRQLINAGVKKAFNKSKENYSETTERPLTSEEMFINIITTTILIILLLVINGFIGKYLWNNVARKLFKGLGEATVWYDTVLLWFLLSLLLPRSV